MTDATSILDVLSRLKWMLHQQARVDEREHLSERDRATQSLMVLMRAVEEMRALGADQEMIVGSLQVAAEALDGPPSRDAMAATAGSH